MRDLWHLEADDIVGDGPSDWYRCTTCGAVYRTLRFVRRVPPPCPTCGDLARERQEQDARARWEATV